MKCPTWCVFVIAALAAPVAPAATFFVTSTADGGTGSLRQAVLNANAAGTGPHSLLLDMPPDRVITLASDLPPISARQLIIDGAGAPNVSIRAPDSGILTLGTDNRLFVLRNLSLGPSNALHSGGCLLGPDEPGSASRTVLVTDVEFFQCRAQPAEPGQLADARGGAMYLAGRGLVLTRGSFLENRVGAPAGFGGYSAAGGAISLAGAASLIASISDSVFIDNVVVGVNPDGGISSRGGAVASLGMQLRVSDSTFRGNVTGGANGRGAHLWVSGNSVVENSVFEEGSSDLGALVATAFTTNASLALYNNTFHRVDGGTGAAVDSNYRTTTLRNNSFNGTESDNPMAIDVDVRNQPTSSASLSMSHNAFQARYPGTLRPVCRISGTLQSSWNLSDRGSPGCGIDVVSAGTLLLQPPVTVADRLTPVAPLSGSTAIDAGNPALPGGGWDTCMINDAIGYRRPQDGDGDGDAICDVGALEVAPDALFADGFEP